MKKLALSPVKWGYTRYLGLSRTKKVVLLVIVGLAVLWRIQAYQNGGLEVTTTKVHKGSVIESIAATGEVKAINAVNMTFPTVGIVQKLPVQEGFFVKEGDILAQIDPTPLYSDLEIAKSNLRNTEATLAEVLDDVHGHDDDETFEQRTARTAAESARDTAYRNLVKAQYNIAHATLRAPFSGYVTNITDGVSLGSYVSPATATFSLVDPNTIYFEAEVNELDVRKISIDQKATIVLDAFEGETFESAVRTINYDKVTTSTGGTAYTVTLLLPDSKELGFRIGMNGDAELILENKVDVLLVPITSLVEEDDKTYVWVVENGKTSKREITTGISSIDEIEITAGVEEGEVIIERPSTNIVEGTRIKKDN